MQNMRRLLKTPTLRLRDGGSSFGDGASPGFSLGRMADTEQNQQAAAGVFARTPDAGSSVMAPPVASPMSASTIQSDGNDPAKRERMLAAGDRANAMRYQPMMAMPGMKDGGDLRTGQGGHVPGSGSGDKVPAKYEPGEFVVSNDMLDSAPGLREQLHDLRGNVLAAKGVTVDEADAKAVSGGSLRAASGGLYPYNMPYKDIYAGLGKPSSAPENTPLPGSITGGAGRRPRAAAGGSWYDPKPNSTGATNGQNQAAVAGVPSSDQRLGDFPGGVRSGVGGGSDRSGQPQPTSRISYGESVRSGLPDTAAVVRDTHDDVASSLSKGRYTGAVVKGLRGSLAMVPAVLNDTVRAAVRGAYGFLRNPAEDAGRALLGMEDRKPDAPAPVAQPVKPPAQPAPNPYTHSPGNATMPGQDPNRVTLRGQAGQDMGNGISKFVQGGKTLYSNVPGADNDKLMSNRPGVSTVPGMSRSEIDRTLTNPDGSRWSANDNAVMAANLRDGINPYAGTSRGQAERGDELQNQLRQLALSPAGTPGRKGALRQLTAMETNQTAKRGQDITERGNVLSNETTLRQNQVTNARAGLTYELDVARFGEEVANKARDNKRAGEKAFDDRVSGFVGTDREGKPDARAASAVRNAANTFLSGKQAEMEAVLAKDPGNKRAAAILDDIMKNGVGGIDDATLRTILLGQQGNTVAREFDGVSLNPWAGKATNTQKPVTSLRLQNNMLMPNQYVTDNGQLIPQRAVEDHPDLRSLIRQ